MAPRSPNTVTRSDFEPTPRVRARLLYWQGWAMTAIAELMHVHVCKIYSWKKTEKWADAPSVKRVEGALEARLIQLISKTQKTSHEFKEVDVLSRQLERLARIHRYNDGGNEADLNPNVRNRNAKPKKKPVRNDISPEQAKELEDAFLKDLFAYQKHWNAVYELHRIINILKSRQIGATYFWARKAIVDAAKTGRNKIFLSASRAQANIFRAYIVAFVHEIIGITLTGDPIILGNGAELHFLGTNAQTAQGYHGDVFVDEYFWIMRFVEFRKVVSGMAMHRKWKQVYCSTPSAITHSAYPFWSGDLFNERRKKGQKVEIDVSHDALKDGNLCADGQYRQIVTVEDAIAAGCNLFDIEQLRLEYSAEEFDNLLMCIFIDDALSAFPFQLLQPCMVDTWECWDDVRPFASRPAGDAPVWVGYDPSGDGEDGDGAGMVVLLPPPKPGGKHRILEKQRLSGDDYDEQARVILATRAKYNVVHIGMDTTGIGDAVAKIVKKKFPNVTAYLYTPQLKAQMVRQAQQAMRQGRLEWDAGWSDLAQSFIAIRAGLTPEGGATTFRAGRNKKTGHAELAWATMHALSHEPIEAPSTGDASNSTMEIYE